VRASCYTVAPHPHRGAQLYGDKIEVLPWRFPQERRLVVEARRRQQQEVGEQPQGTLGVERRQQKAVGKQQEVGKRAELQEEFARFVVSRPFVRQVVEQVARLVEQVVARRVVA